ncbi:xyloglucan endo-transglycosylase/hydrolase1 [Zea mays]|uniref:Xyloglucan endo-transglycosylase/hydrolase1 n=1 Tax=Zea mays TaxID=4577 RepID=A0A1D6IZ02_MAIZE|nr:xyloglucan endo-transglycosylase/hydrolase1 [Zea mays]
MARRSLALLLASSLALMAAAVASADSWLYDKFNTVDWSAAPFVVSYRGYSANACVSGGACGGGGDDGWMSKQPDDAEWGTIRWAESNYMRYNYCDDGWRFPQGLPPECSRS